MHCKNCETELQPEHKYCNHCGAPIVTQKLTLKKVFGEFAERYLSLDNKFLTTFKTLITKPEEVINGYLNGVRMKYVNPITYLFVAVTFSGINIFLMRKGYLGSIDYTQITGVQKTPFDMNTYMNTIYDYNSIMVFCSLPILALISKIVFFNFKKYNYAEHNVIYFYTYSQMSIIMVLTVPFVMLFNLDYFKFTYVYLIVMFAYHVYALRKIFQLSIKKIFIKTLLFLPIGFLFYIILSLSFAIIFVVYLIYTGQFNPEDFAK